MRRQGAEVHIASFRPVPVEGARQILPLAPRSGSLSYSDFIFGASQLKTIIKEVKPDVLLCSFTTTYGLLGYLSGFRPFIVQTWSRDIGMDPHIPLRHKLLVRFPGLRILEKADGITADSESFKDHLIDRFPNWKHKLLATSWGIDPEAFAYTQTETASFREVLSIPDSATLIASVRGIKYYYQPEWIIPSLKKLLEKRPDYHALVLTLGHTREIRAAGLLEELKSHPRFHVIEELLPVEEMARLWQAVDFFISAPLFDGIPESVQEGALSGALPVLNDIPANRELMRQGLQAFILDSVQHEPAELARSLESFIRTGSQTLERMKEKNRDFILNHRNVNVTAQRLIRFMEQLSAGTAL